MMYRWLVIAFFPLSCATLPITQQRLFSWHHRSPKVARFPPICLCRVFVRLQQAKSLIQRSFRGLHRISTRKRRSRLECFWLHAQSPRCDAGAWRGIGAFLGLAGGRGFTAALTGRRAFVWAVPRAALRWLSTPRTKTCSRGPLLGYSRCIPTGCRLEFLHFSCRNAIERLIFG
jgi:hypothetical protein